MKKVLFINSCVRGREHSRTYKIAAAYLEALKRNDREIEIVEQDLMTINPPYLTYENFEKRDQLILERSFDHEMFDLAKEFAQSDIVVVAAPFWEFGFPAILGSYLENIAVAGITFEYTQTGSIGRCKAKRLIYIATYGGDFSAAALSHLRIGERHLEALCGMFGIGSFDTISAYGLDILGADVEGIVNAAIEEAEKSETIHDSTHDGIQGRCGY